MAAIKSGNWSFKEPTLKDGDVVTGGNFSQLRPDTEICKAVKTLTVKGGNFVNCKPQPTWIIEGGNWCQIEFCTHDRPDLIERGLTPCAVACVHRSPVKVQEVVDEKQYRAYVEASKDVLSAVQPGDLSIVKAVDKDGVTVQQFKVAKYQFKPAVLKCGSAQIKTAVDNRFPEKIEKVK